MLGGIAAGKSHVARTLAAEFKATVIDADRLAGAALEAAARDGSLVRILGATAVGENGAPDREAIAARVFADPAGLERLEARLHPPVLQAIEEGVRRFRAGAAPSDAAPATPALLVLDVPLLLEKGLDRLCDVLWFVAVPEDVRRSRAAARGLDDAELSRREGRQIPPEEKRARAHFVIHNERPLLPQIQEGLSLLPPPSPRTTP